MNRKPRICRRGKHSWGGRKRYGVGRATFMTTCCKRCGVGKYIV